MPPDVYHVRRPTIPRSPGFLCPKTRLFPPCLTDITDNTCQCCQKHHKKDDAKGQELRFRHLPLFRLTAQICQQTKHHAADGTESTHCPAHFLFIIFARSSLEDVPNPAMSQLPFPPYKKPLMIKNSAANINIQTTAIIPNTSKCNQ